MSDVQAKHKPNKAKRKSKSAKPAVSHTTKQRRQKGGTGMNDLFIGVFGVAFLLSFSLNFLHSTERIAHQHESPVQNVLRDFRADVEAAKKAMRLKNLARHQQKTHVRNNVNLSPLSEVVAIPSAEEKMRDDTANNNDDDDEDEAEAEDPDKDSAAEHAFEIRSGNPVMSKLNCDRYGGPSEESAQELVYWQEIPSDAAYINPFRLQSNNRERYMTFEPDGGGWNNIRMAMESVFGLAVAMGRTLVMPPQKRMYLLGQGRREDKKHFGFADFFPIQDIIDEHDGLTIISMQQYLEDVAMTGQLIDKTTGKVSFPPGNRTNWDGVDQKDYDVLRGYLRNVTMTARWSPGKCIAAFPASGNHRDIQVVNGHIDDILKDTDGKLRENAEKFIGNPAPVDGTPRERLEENLAGRTELCVYDEKMQQEHTIHFQCNHKEHLRMLVHFYAFLFFEDWREDLWMKRFIRDHIRYKDEIQCAAARVVEAVRKRARERDPTNNPDGVFDSFHVRRGDFQYEQTRIPAETIYKNTQDELTAGTTVFIATDERDKSFFDPLKKVYDVVFLNDYMNLLEGVNPNYYGMIDQLVSSRGRVFFGCYFSTFTGYIMRIRGYHSVHEEQPGHEDGVLPTTYYYVPMGKKLEMHRYHPMKPGFFNREFPTSWRGINKGIGTMTVSDM